MIDLAFVISYFVCLVCLWIFGMDHLNAVWRITLGLGCVPPLFLLYFRLKMHEVSRTVMREEHAHPFQPEAYKKNSMKHTSIPYWLLFKR